MARNTDSLGIKLGKMIPARIQECEAEFEEAIEIIADNVADSIQMKITSEAMNVLRR